MSASLALIWLCKFSTDIVTVSFSPRIEVDRNVETVFTSELSLQMRADKSSRMNAEMFSADNVTAFEISSTDNNIADDIADTSFDRDEICHAL